jgi:cell division septal protein FtsQ
MVLTYGHFAVAMYIYSNFKNPQNSQSKKIKIVVVGLVVLFGWLYLSPRFGYEKIKIINSSGNVLYHSEKTE